MQNILNDSINRIQNGQKFLFSEIEVVGSKVVLNFLKLLYKEGFIRGFKKKKKKCCSLLKIL